MDIYRILASKPNNFHYLNRYITFIQRCQQKNVGYTGPIHKHHICPRGKDMFPEYSSLVKFKWNRADLTPRQHFIAHILLWKAYPQSSTQRNAVWQMKHKNKEKMNSRIYESLLKEYSIRLSSNTKGKISVKDSTGNFLLIPTEQYDNSVHTPIAAGRVVAKNENEDIIVVSTEEFRNNPNLVGHSKGKVAWNNGIIVIYSCETPGDNFVRGLLPISEEEKKKRNEKRIKTFSEKTKEELEKSRRNYSDAAKKRWSAMSVEDRKKSLAAREKLSNIRKIHNPGFSLTHKCPCCGKEGQKANIAKHHGLDGRKCKWGNR